ncbi:hypothetical protein CDAR_13451 [Caerostris darwini]|uniref:Uncharacterized protein n=1 Tax=Caerostris darwini TaxID=1538125 RepID=A0AAV4UEH6_9ARAC|nr:hypothetical protein CDAR_13451 [Caerostris darwini]
MIEDLSPKVKVRMKLKIEVDFAARTDSSLFYPKFVLSSSQQQSDVDIHTAAILAKTSMRSTIEGQCWEDHEEIPLNASKERNSSDEVVLLRLTKVIRFNSSLGNPVVSKSTIEGQCWKDPVKKGTLVNHEYFDLTVCIF